MQGHGQNNHPTKIMSTFMIWDIVSVQKLKEGESDGENMQTSRFRFF